LHISNKIAAELNGSYTSNIGVTGFGVRAKVFLSVIILGIITVSSKYFVLEHRMEFSIKIRYHWE
jgi:iron complex outermembrane receptor protein